MEKPNEYSLGCDGTPVDLERLKAVRMPDKTYTEANASLVISCQDVYISIPNQNGERGLLLVKRLQEPAKGVLWPIGGKKLRGTSEEESLRQKAREECGLELENITYLGWARLFFQKSPLGHGKGTDADGHNYFARGVGEISLNELHSNPTIITPDQYTDEFREGLHPYMKEFMDKAMRLL